MRDGQTGRPPRQRVAFLLAQLGAHVSQRFTQRVSALGLTASEAGVLRLVGQSPGLTQRAIADRLGTAPSRIVGLVDELEGRKLLSRSRSSTDRRNYELQLTAQGEELLAALRRIAEAHEAEVTAGLTPQQVEDLAAVLRALVEMHHLDAELHAGTGPRAEV